MKTRIAAALFVFLLINSGYLAAYPAASLFYMGNVVAHLAVGLLLMVAAAWAVKRYPLESGAFLAAGLVAAFLLAKGNTFRSECGGTPGRGSAAHGGGGVGREAISIGKRGVSGGRSGGRVPPGEGQHIRPSRYSVAAHLPGSGRGSVGDDSCPATDSLRGSGLPHRRAAAGIGGRVEPRSSRPE